MKVGIVGTRRRDTSADYVAVERAFERFHGGAWPELSPTWIISGGCPKGGDRFAQQIAKKYGLPITIFYPDWRRFGKGAGFVRNDDIAAACDVLIACVALDRTGGTEDTIRKVERLGKEVIIVE